MTKAEQALAIWQALPQQHAACLTVIYRADQDAEAEQRDAWTSGGRPQRAAVWRWLPYRPGRTTTPPSENLAVQLRAHGLDHTQASSIFTALAEQRLVELRAASTARGQDVKLTTWGRKVARAGGIDPARADKDLLSEGLWQMLTQVWRAHPDGHLTGYSGAWDHLLDRTPDPYVRTESARDRRAMFLTDAGADHYRARWRSYARAYPDVDAPHPDNAQFWPPHIDQALTRLRTDCQTIRDLITTIPEAITDLTAPGAAAPPPEIDLPHLPAAAPPG
ncbi:MAG: hypothetical protein ACRDNL_06780, partial [Spirillospora sp.]